MGITSTQFATLLCCEGNWIATNMVALPNLWLLITFALLSNHVEARGCQCHVKENDAATAIESFHTYVRGFLARCSNRRRGICHKALTQNLETGTSTVSWTAMAHVLFPNGGRKNF